MEDNSNLSVQNEITLNRSMSSVINEEEMEGILKDLHIKGEITDKNHQLVAFLKDKGRKLKKSRIKYSYTHTQTLWKEFQIEDKIYLFRIINKIDDNVKNLIRNEFKLHEECEDINSLAPKFICYYFSDFFNFSVFIINEYYTLEEILSKTNLPSFSGDDSFIDFSKSELLLSALETIKNLKSKENYYFVCPYITSSDLLYTESSGKEYFLLSEIFLKVDSKEKEINIELNNRNKNIKEWLAPEFVKNKAKLSFESNIACLGNIFYKIGFNQAPSKSININENSVYKELIDNCLKEKWDTDKIQEYINDNDFEEKEDENNENFGSNNQIIDNNETYNDSRDKKTEMNDIISENFNDNNIIIYDNKEIKKNDINNLSKNSSIEIENEILIKINKNKNGDILRQKENRKNLEENKINEKIQEFENKKLEKEKINEEEEKKKKILEEEKEKMKKDIETYKKLVVEKKLEEENYLKQKEEENRRRLEEEKKKKEEEEKKKKEEGDKKKTEGDKKEEKKDPTSPDNDIHMKDCTANNTKENPPKDQKPKENEKMDVE